MLWRNNQKKDATIQEGARYILYITLSFLIFIFTLQFELDRQKRALLETLVDARVQLEQAMLSAITPSLALKSMVIAHRGVLNSENLVRFANDIQKLSINIMAVQLAPDGVVRFTTRLDQNKAAIGHNLLVDMARRPEALRAIRERQTFLVGPVDLLQGRSAVIARTPIFIPGWKSETTFSDFYGFAVSLIDIEAIYDAVSLDWRLYALRGRNGTGIFGDVFAGDPEVFDGPFLQSKVILPNGEWILATREPGLMDAFPWAFFVLIVTLSLSMYMIRLNKVDRHQKRKSVYDIERLKMACKIGKLGFIEKLDDDQLIPSAGAREILETSAFDPLPSILSSNLKEMLLEEKFDINSDRANCRMVTFMTSNGNEKTIEVTHGFSEPELPIIVVQDISNTAARHEHEINVAKLASIGELVAGVAHELNTPLQYITDNLYFLRKCNEDLFSTDRVPAEQDIQSLMSIESMQEYRYEVPAAIDDCIDGTQRMAGIVSAMKLYATPAEEELVDVNVIDVIENAMALTSGTHKNIADISFGRSIKAKFVRGNQSSLTQVFINLINNSCDAIAERRANDENAPDGKIEIEMIEKDKSLIIQFDDNGGGIPCEIQGKMFDLFFTTKPMGKGTGQGLSISKAIVNKCNGHFSYKSKEPDGSRFLIKLDLSSDYEANIAATEIEQSREDVTRDDVID